jgi:hypothetical protein
MFGKILSKRAWILLVASLCMGAIIFGIYTLKLMFTEDLYTNKGTYAYYLTIRSSTIKNFPQLKKVGKEEYYFSCGDGPKRMANGINYLTEEQPEHIAEPLDRYLKSRGFVKDERRSNGESYYYKGTGSTFELDIKPDETGFHRVIGTEYYPS